MVREVLPPFTNWLDGLRCCEKAGQNEGYYQERSHGVNLIS
jgi:hypothetical protein